MVEESAAVSASAKPASFSSKKSNESNASNNDAIGATFVNARWKGYGLMALTSIIEFFAIANVQDDTPYGVKSIPMSVNILLFAFCITVLILTSTECGVDVLDYQSMYDGKLEGACLFSWCLVGIVNTAYVTQVGGLAYESLNVYVSAWLTVGTTFYTLNAWSGSRDILTFREMVCISTTLKSWYILFGSSLVLLGTCINMLIVLLDITDNVNTDDTRAASFGIAFGLLSTVMSLAWILVHYNLIELCVEGGWFELACIGVVVLMWVVGAAVLTQDGGIAATIIGQSCQYQWVPPTDSILVTLIKTEFRIAQETTLAPDCEVILGGVKYFCDQFYNLRDEEAKLSLSYSSIPIVPGSNLYCSVWWCLLASLNLVNRWKAQQAIQFAQAQQEKAFSSEAATNGNNTSAAASPRSRISGSFRRSRSGDDDDDDSDDDE